MENRNISAKSNFEILASNLSKEERSDILNQIQQDNLELSFSTGESDDNLDKERKKEEKLNLLEKFKQEPLLYRLFLWIKSLLLNSSIETIYNNSVVSSFSKNLDHDFPDMIDCKNKSLLTGFYNALIDLKKAQEFFKPFFDSLEAVPGIFYFHLGACVMPEVVQEIKSSCDLYNYPFEKPLPADIRNIIFTKLNSILAGISSEEKLKMSSFAKEFEHLKLFSKLPLSSAAANFSSGSSHSCSFAQIKEGFDCIAHVVSGGVPCSDTTLSVLFMSCTQKSDLWNSVSSSYEETAKNVSAAMSEISMVNMFSEKIPLEKFGKVVFGNSLYAPMGLSFADLWFQKFREQWKVVLDGRLRQWNKEFRKAEAKKMLAVSFGIPDFPKYPACPWEKTGGDFICKHELSLGFLNWCLKTELPKYKQLLATITLEGKFSIKENMYEFSDMISELNSFLEKNNAFEKRLSASGDYGAEIIQCVSSGRKQDREKLAGLAVEIEENASWLIETFAKFLAGFENLLLALLGEKSTVYYGPLLNLRKIQGADNKEFCELFEKLTRSIKSALEVFQAIGEMESISV
ncbi:DUF5312 family protein [Treponema sp.]|uniref:DUF5312 family protein n=1 Tax=Treponema sp. TaxID=166 RepID=UPI003F0649AD